MTNTQGWEQQQGGLWLKVSSYNKDNTKHRETAVDVMRGCVETMARSHGATVDPKAFNRNMRAANAGDLELEFYLATWDVCERKPVCVGAAFGWDTYGFTSDGQLVRSVYTEDVCLLTSQMRELISVKPKGKGFPEESLAKCFERISLNQMKRDGIAHRYGEVAPDNTAMLRQLGGNGASMGIGLGSAVLEYQRFPENLLDKFPVNVETIPIMRNGVRSDRHFIVRWTEGSHDIRFIVTKGQATALGKPRADIRPWHNGSLPDQAILECVIASALQAIKQEAEDRKWSSQQDQALPSPVIPLLEPKPRIFSALYNAAGGEIGVNVVSQSTSFGKPMPDAHIFVQNDPALLNGLMAVGAKRRLFGNRPMMPGVNVLKLRASLMA